MGLKLQEYYGTIAQEIYVEQGQKYGWNYLMRNLFTFRHSLYAKDVNRAGHSVWFICYSNLNGKKTEEYANIIFGATYDKIEERWFNMQSQADIFGAIREDDTRIVFTKKLRGKTGKEEYFFMGVFKPKGVREETSKIGGKEIKYLVRTFERVSEVYPCKLD